MTTQTQTRDDAIEMVANVLTDARRSDRYLRWSEEYGRYYTTPDRTYINDDGPYTTPYVEIPAAGGADAEEYAAELLAELDAALAESAP